MRIHMLYFIKTHQLVEKLLPQKFFVFLSQQIRYRRLKAVSPLTNTYVDQNIVGELLTVGTRPEETIMVEVSKIFF